MNIPDLYWYSDYSAEIVSSQTVFVVPSGMTSPQENLPASLNLQTIPTIHQARPEQPKMQVLIFASRKPTYVLITEPKRPKIEAAMGDNIMMKPQRNQFWNLRWMSMRSPAEAAMPSSLFIKSAPVSFASPYQAD